MKKLRILIIISLIIIILTITIIFLVKNKLKINERDNLQTVKNTAEYFSVSEAIEKYSIYLISGEFDKAYSLLDEEYIKKYGITKENLEKDYNEAYACFIPQKISVQEKDEYCKIYFVKGIAGDLSSNSMVYVEYEDEDEEKNVSTVKEINPKQYKDNVCYIVKVDLENSSFSISGDISKYQKIFDSM